MIRERIIRKSEVSANLLNLISLFLKKSDTGYRLRNKYAVYHYLIGLKGSIDYVMLGQIDDFVNVE